MTTEIAQSGQDDICRVLDGLGVDYRVTEHPAVYTVEEADREYGHLPGGHSKNLFLRNKKGSRHYLVVVESRKQVDLKTLRGALGESALSFASPERLMRYLGLTPGAVSPFGLINDRDGAVHVVVDRDLLAHAELNFHPNVNTATVTLPREAFERFLAHTGHAPQLIDIPESAGP